MGCSGGRPCWVAVALVIYRAVGHPCTTKQRRKKDTTNTTHGHVSQKHNVQAMVAMSKPLTKPDTVYMAAIATSVVTALLHTSTRTVRWPPHACAMLCHGIRKSIPWDSSTEYRPDQIYNCG